MAKKVAMIGAGSIVFCKTLMSDIMATPALGDSDFALMDCTEPKLRRMEEFGKRMLKEKLDSVFTAASQPSNVRVSEQRPNLRGPGWTACVKAEVVSVTGKSLGTQTYRVEISDGAIADRRQIETEDTCNNESYEPI